ncbi:MAG: class I SAM-dependent methyltransferase [bacterium]|nr:class I SAM-dependent methyltransferase [bacterium]
MEKQSEWFQQWSMLEDRELFLFQEWIAPLTLEDFTGKDVLEGGCGGGQHTSFIAPYAKHISAVDLNTAEIAKRRNQQFENITFLEADISAMRLEKRFDIVFSIGVVHHTDDPDKTVENLKRHVKPGGKLVLWVYSKEDNFLVEHVVEPLRKLFLRHLPKATLLTIARAICLLMYLPIYTLYLLPWPFLPYFEYFQNFRKLSFQRNVLNVFDKLNAPQVQFITSERIQRWFEDRSFNNLKVSPYKGVSWRVCATKRSTT